MKTVLIFLLKIYRYAISPVMPSHCRFYPSCSCYSQEAIEKHGAFWGTVLTAKRLCKCHPFNAGGIDPVPEQPPSFPKIPFKFRQL